MESTVPRSGQASVGGDLALTLFGRVHLASAIGDITPTAQKDKALLAFLASSPEQTHRRSRLAALLWSESEGARARESLKQALLRLKRSLPDGLLDTDRHTARLRLERRQVDLARVEDLLAIGTPEALPMVMETCDGVFLAGLEDVSGEFEDWRNERHRKLLDSLRRVAIEAMERAMALGDPGQTERLAVRMTRLDPLDEEAVRHLIAARAAAGRLRQATRAFDELRTRLHDELGVEPETATRALVESLASAATRSTSDACGTPTIPRIAVLPFDVEADESSQRYFAEGLTDDITTDLARNEALEVLPASAFAGPRGDVSRVLLARRATHVLRGSVRRANGKLRVNTRLTDARDDQIVWAQRYDRALDDVFDMQDAISSQIVMRLHLELSPAIASGASHGTRNAHAYEMFHKGRSLYLRGINNHSLRAARALLERSIDIDPGFARAYAQLAICESYLAMSIVNKTGEDFSAQVLQHGRTALEMKPDLALGHAAVGLAFYAAGHYDDAESALRNAIGLDERLFEAQFFLARNRHLQGDHAGAVHRFRLAAALRPDDFRSSGLLGDALKATGTIEDAAEAFAIAVERIEAELNRHPDNAGALAFGAPILAELGRPDQAREWCDWALAIEPGDRLLRYNLARLFAILDDTRTALEHLEAAFDAPQLVQRRLALWMRHDSDFGALASNRRFGRLLEFARRPIGDAALRIGAGEAESRRTVAYGPPPARPCASTAAADVPISSRRSPG